MMWGWERGQGGGDPKDRGMPRGAGAGSGVWAWGSPWGPGADRSPELQEGSPGAVGPCPRCVPIASLLSPPCPVPSPQSRVPALSPPCPFVSPPSRRRAPPAARSGRGGPGRVLWRRSRRHFGVAGSGAGKRRWIPEPARAAAAAPRGSPESTNW